MMYTNREWEEKERICLACHYKLPIDMFHKAGTGHRRSCIVCYEEDRVTIALLNMAQRISHMESMQRARGYNFPNIKAKYLAYTKAQQ